MVHWYTATIPTQLPQNSQAFYPSHVDERFDGCMVKRAPSSVFAIPAVLRVTPLLIVVELA